MTKVEVLDELGHVELKFSSCYKGHVNFRAEHEKYDIIAAIAMDDKSEMYITADTTLPLNHSGFVAVNVRNNETGHYLFTWSINDGWGK